jgi:hypothetical protein
MRAAAEAPAAKKSGGRLEPPAAPSRYCLLVTPATNGRPFGSP